MAIIQADKDNYTHNHFESIDDMLNMEIPAKNMPVYRSNRDFRGKYWFGMSDSFDGTVEMIKSGWKEGLAQAQRVLESVQMPKVRSSRRRRVQTDFGDHFDIQKMYAGQLDRAWTTTKRERSFNTGAHNATIVVELATSGSVDSDKCFWRGATAVMVADMLQAAGRNVKIIGMSTVDRLYKSNRNLRQCTTVVLKDYNQPLDLDMLMATTSAGMNRTLLFDSKLIRTDKGLISDGLGHPVLGFLPDYLDDGSNVIRIEDIWSKSAAERKLADVAGDYNGAV